MSVAIIEVRPGPGGDEARIWASDLIRMYSKFATKNGWKVKSIGETALKITGPDAFKLLKNEGGVHRVQRVPTTEKRGRIHTSTASVAVLPEIPQSEVIINPNDIEWEFFRASSHGGQNVQKVSSAARVKHKPTGINVACQEERTQEQNRENALSLLRIKIWEKQEAEKMAKFADYRSVIGNALRSEKIRTYNYARNKVVDHRIKKKFRLEDIVDGKLEKILNALDALS